MASNVIDISVEEREFKKALETFEEMEASIDARYLKNVQRRYAMKEMVPDMKRSSHSVRLEKVIGVTTSKKRAGDLGIKVGIIDAGKADDFPDFNAYGLASVIEYGTAERYRQLKSVGLITGRQSTGDMPAFPFLRPAWDRNVRKLMSDVETAILKRIERAADG